MFTVNYIRMLKVRSNLAVNMTKTFCATQWSTAGSSRWWGQQRLHIQLLDACGTRRCGSAVITANCFGAATCTSGRSATLETTVGTRRHLRPLSDSATTTRTSSHASRSRPKVHAMRHRQDAAARWLVCTPWIQLGFCPCPVLDWLPVGCCWKTKASGVLACVC